MEASTDRIVDLGETVFRSVLSAPPAPLADAFCSEEDLELISSSSDENSIRDTSGTYLSCPSETESDEQVAEVDMAPRYRRYTEDEQDLEVEQVAMHEDMIEDEVDVEKGGRSEDERDTEGEEYPEGERSVLPSKTQVASRSQAPVSRQRGLSWEDMYLADSIEWKSSKNRDTQASKTLAKAQNERIKSPPAQAPRTSPLV
jgi:hypothetical protein